MKFFLGPGRVWGPPRCQIVDLNQVWMFQDSYAGYCLSLRRPRLSCGFLLVVCEDYIFLFLSSVACGFLFLVCVENQGVLLVFNLFLTSLATISFGFLVMGEENAEYSCGLLCAAFCFLCVEQVVRVMFALLDTGPNLGSILVSNLGFRLYLNLGLNSRVRTQV